MFEDLFGKKEAIKTVKPKGITFEGLFEKPLVKKRWGEVFEYAGWEKIDMTKPGMKELKEAGFAPPTPTITVSLTEDLKGVKREDTGEVILKEQFTPEMKTAWRGMLEQLSKAQREAVEKIPTTYPGIIKEEVKGVWEKIKQIPTTIKEWPGKGVSWKDILTTDISAKEQFTELIPEGTAEFFTGGYKGVSQTLIGLGNIFTKILPYSEEQKKGATEEAKLLQQKYAITDPAEIPGYIFEKVAEIGIASGITNSVLLKAPTVAKFASTYPKIYSSLSFGVTGTALGQIRMESDASWQQRLKQASIDFPSWTAWGAVGGVPVKAFYKYMPAYFTIGYVSAILEGQSQEDAITTGISSATIGSIFKMASIPKKAHDVMLKDAQSTFKKYGAKDFTKQSYYKLAHQYHPDKIGGSEKIMKDINNSWMVLSKTPAELQKGIMKEFKDLIKSVVKRPIPTKRAIVPFVPPIEPKPSLTKIEPKSLVPKVAPKVTAIIPKAKVEVKPKVEAKVVPEAKPIPKELEPLAVEARKFKSAEEFVEAQPITYHGTDFAKGLEKGVKPTYLTALQKAAGIKEKIGFSLTTDISVAKRYGETVKEYYIDPSAKIATPKDLPEVKFTKFEDGEILYNQIDAVKLAKEKGFDGVDINAFEQLTSKPRKVFEIQIFNTDILRTKQQLQDFYAQATKEVKPVVKAKLPEIKKPPIKEEVVLHAFIGMPDPGVDKFLAEEVRPILNKATEAGRYLFKETKHIPEFLMRIIEPAKLVPGEPYATVIRGIHKPEARLVEFDQKRLETMDVNISELEKWFNKFSDKDLENLMLTRGKTTSPEARKIQVKAFAEISKELKVPSVKRAIQEIADFNYKFLQEVAGKDIHKVEDYFYGMYKNPKKVNKFLDYWRSTERFTKQKKLPTVADAEAYGLELIHKNPVANLRAEFRAIAKLEGMVWMREELLRTGKGIYIEEMAKAPVEWDKVNDPVFRELRVEPNLARLINNLISTNKITRVPVANFIRNINNALRTYKFIGSAFHLGVIGKQSVADSGYLGFAYKKTAVKGVTFGFRTNDPIFQTPEYLEYIELGGGHKYSVEFEAKRILVKSVDKINRGNYLGAFTQAGIIPAKIPIGFVNWMFNQYIPKVKYAKYLDFVATKEKTLGRMITDAEKIEIIKEGQNFYGMMNERLFGRSGTTTTALRFIFLAPGFAEGNFRTILKAFSQWGVKGTYGAGRSRFNIVNSLIITGLLATVGTLIFTKKLPKKPEKLEDIRDLFKIDTGKVDKNNKRIMIDLMTYDKDYWNITFNVLRGRPDKAVTESVKRLGGMKAPTFEMMTDFALMLQGKAIYDWKDDKITEITDPFLQKLMKLSVYQIQKLEPISWSVYKQLRRKEVDRSIALIEAMMGVRPAKTEADKREQEIRNRLFSLRDQQEQLYYYLGTINKPKKAIEDYNKIVSDVLNGKMIPQEMRDEWEPKLLIDIDRLLSNKVYQLTDPMEKLTKEEKEKEIEKIKKYLKNFEVTDEELSKHLRYYWQEHPVESPWSKTHRENVIKREIRLKERY